jgi:UDP-glucose 4-epimerase
MNDKPIVVTGGAGFIGSHLVERLLQEGRAVVVLDDLSTGNLANLAAVRSHPDLRIIVAKVSEFEGLQSLLAEADYVFHLAAAVGVELVVKSPVHTIRTNLEETESILESASRTQTPVLLASSSEVYGKSAKASFSEEDDLLIGPPHLGRWSYACSKLMDEFLALAYAQEHGLPVTIVRFFNIVGPRQTGRYGMVLPRFVAAARKNEPLRVYGDGQQTRCFCLVKDAVEALTRLQRCPEARGQVFNVGTDEEVSIIELAQRVVKLLQSSSDIQFIPYATAYAEGFQDMLRRKPDLRKLIQFIGFHPETGLRDTIRITADAFQP